MQSVLGKTPRMEIAKHWAAFHHWVSAAAPGHPAALLLDLVCFITAFLML